MITKQTTTDSNDKGKFQSFSYDSNKTVVSRSDLQRNAVAEGFIDSNVTSTTASNTAPIFATTKILTGDGMSRRYFDDIYLSISHTAL